MSGFISRARSWSSYWNLNWRTLSGSPVFCWRLLSILSCSALIACIRCFRSAFSFLSFSISRSYSFVKKLSVLSANRSKLGAFRVSIRWLYSRALTCCASSLCSSWTGGNLWVPPNVPGVKEWGLLGSINYGIEAYFSACCSRRPAGISVPRRPWAALLVFASRYMNISFSFYLASPRTWSYSDGLIYEFMSSRISSIGCLVRAATDLFNLALLCCSVTQKCLSKLGMVPPAGD